MVREEGKREKMRTKMGRKAVRYEERLEKGGVAVDERENVGRKLRKEGKRVDRCGRNRGRAFTKRGGNFQ